MSNAIDRLEEMERRAREAKAVILNLQGSTTMSGAAIDDERARENTAHRQLEQAEDAVMRSLKPLLAVVRIAERINADLAFHGDNIVTDDDKEALRLALATLKEMQL